MFQLMKCAAKVYFDAQLQASEGEKQGFFFFFFNKSVWWALCWLNAVLNLLGVYLCVCVDAWGHGRGVCVCVLLEVAVCLKVMLTVHT